jgi:PAS domain S-box-containing protein
MKTNRVANLLVTSILLTLVSTGVKYYNVTQKNQFFSLALDTHQAMRMAVGLGSKIMESDNHRRGYIMTSSQTELELYRRAMHAITPTYDTLLQMSKGNGSAVGILKKQVRPQISLFISASEHVVKDATGNELQNREQFDESAHAAVARIQSSLARVIADLEAGLESRNQQLRSVYRVNDIIHYTSFILICFISGLAIKTILDKEKKNKELLSSLQESNHSLDTNVRERTTELEKKTLYAEKLTRDLQDNFNELQSFYETLHVSNARAEDTLTEMRDLYENAPVGYHSLNADGVIVRMNQTELGWLGYSREEVIGKMHVTQILVPEEHHIYHNSFANFLKTGYVRNIQHTFVRKDGTRIKVSLSASAMYDDKGKYIMSRGVSNLVI